MYSFHFGDLLNYCDCKTIISIKIGKWIAELILMKEVFPLQLFTFYGKNARILVTSAHVSIKLPIYTDTGGGGDSCWWYVMNKVWVLVYAKESCFISNYKITNYDNLHAFMNVLLRGNWVINNDFPFSFQTFFFLCMLSIFYY